jgi:hypothetical protein
MTETPNCPYCNRPVSPSLNYIFVPLENKRWHESCFRAANPATEGQGNDHHD